MPFVEFIQTNLDAPTFIPGRRPVIAGGDAPLMWGANTAHATHTLAPKYLTSSVKFYLARLADPRFALLRPIELQFICEDDQFVIEFPEAEISTSGDTPSEALAWMQEAIVGLFQTLRSGSDLGPLPKRQLRVLESVIVQKQDSKARS